MAATHDSQIDVTVNLAPPATSQAGFGAVLLLDDGSTLSGDDYKAYEEIETASNDLDASELTQFGYDFVEAALSQTPAPDKVYIGAVDTSATDTFTDIYDVIANDVDDFWAVCISSREAADIVDMADYIETTSHFFIAQSSDADWLTADLPTDLEDLDGDERTAVLYHDVDDEPAAEAWAASRLVFDPDERSAPWTGSVAGVAGYDSSLTTTERDAAKDNNANVMLPFGDASTYVFDGVNVSGRDIYEMLTLDWFVARIQERFTDLKQQYDQDGEKIPLSATGQNIARGEIEAQIEDGEDGQHFLPGESSVEFPETIPQSDLDNNELNGEGELVVAESANKFGLTFTMSN